MVILQAMVFAAAPGAVNRNLITLTLTARNGQNKPSKLELYCLELKRVCVGNDCQCSFHVQWLDIVQSFRAEARSHLQVEDDT